MINLKGKYDEAIVYTDIIENNTISQIIQMLNQEWSKNSHMRIMPDTHAGSGATIGTTFYLQKSIKPSVVGTDIGCGVTVINTGIKTFDHVAIEKYVKENIPFGSTINETCVYDFTSQIKSLRCYKELDKKMELYNNSLMSVGGGNHFFEGNINSKGELLLSVHSGSRNLGGQVAGLYEKLAFKAVIKKLMDDKIQELKSLKREKEIESELEIVKKYINSNLESLKNNSCLIGDLLDDYLHDIKIVQEYASLNRQLILEKVLMDYFKMTRRDIMALETIDSIHNYIDTQNRIVRKGAISANAGEKLVIPMNMRDGILVCIGKGNSEWNHSAPHGAGRLYSRSMAKELFTLEEFIESMNGVYSTSINQSTIDESPMVYKPMDVIMEQIKDTVDIIEVIKPIFNVKASKFLDDSIDGDECEGKIF